MRFQVRSVVFTAELAGEEIIGTLWDAEDLALELRVEDVHVVLIWLRVFDRGFDFGEGGGGWRYEEHLRGEGGAC